MANTISRQTRNDKVLSLSLVYTHTQWSNETVIILLSENDESHRCAISWGASIKHTISQSMIILLVHMEPKLHLSL